MKSPVRFAVGTPSGLSTNSWKIWVHREDTYVACRDNFREIKISLHASGRWRIGFTQNFIKVRPETFAEGKDRVWKKWKPSLDAAHPYVIGFQLLAPQPSLYLQPKDRRGWPKSVIFVEPPTELEQMTVISVTVVLGRQPLVGKLESIGGIIAMLPLGSDKTVQVVATYEKLGDVLDKIDQACLQAVNQFKWPEAVLKHGVFLAVGNRGQDVTWISAVPFRAYRADREGEGA